MSERLSQNKIDWYVNLPQSFRPDAFAGYTKTCLCGEVFWFAIGQTTHEEVDTWINKHFGHTGVYAEKKTEFTIHELYDFSKPVKFSRVGFELFIETYRLQRLNVLAEATCEGVKRYVDNFIDEKGNRFAFEYYKMRSATELYAYIVPQLTEVRV